jgi:hypothetical protein
MGWNGNGVHLEDVASWEGIGKGTVVVVTQCVIHAMTCPHCLKVAIHWPTPHEIEEAKQWVEKTSGCKAWRNGWLIVDRTLVPFYAWPHYYGESDFDCKCNYSMNFQVCTIVISSL